MTTEDLMKLADKFAFFMPGSEEGEKARQALLDALQSLVEAREAEIERLTESLGREVAEFRTEKLELDTQLQMTSASLVSARAELAAIRATQEPVAYELSAIKYANGKELVYTVPTALASYIKVTPLYASPADKDAGLVAVPLEFVQGFNTLAHNYSLQAVAPDFYHGVERDAFCAAYKRCGQSLAELRSKIGGV